MNLQELLGAGSSVNTAVAPTGLNVDVALRRRIYLEPNLVRERAERFSLVSSMLGDRLSAVLRGAKRLTPRHCFFGCLNKPAITAMRC